MHRGRLDDAAVHYDTGAEDTDAIRLLTRRARAVKTTHRGNRRARRLDADA